MEQLATKILKFAGKDSFDMTSADFEVPSQVVLDAETALDIPWKGIVFAVPPADKLSLWLKKFAEEALLRPNIEIWTILPCRHLNRRFFKDLVLENNNCVFGFPEGKDAVMIACFSCHAPEIQMAWNYFNVFKTKAFL